MGDCKQLNCEWHQFISVPLPELASTMHAQFPLELCEILGSLFETSDLFPAGSSFYFLIFNSS
jgi:hypothetical protein